MRKSALAAGVSILALTATLVTAPAHAHRDHDREPDVVATGLAGPLTIAVGHQSDVYVTQSFAGLLSKVDKRGRVTDVHQLDLPPDAGFLVGVAYDNRSTYHVETDFTGEAPTSHVIKTSKKGKRTAVSDDLWAYEASNNPDASQTYGFRGLDEADATCAAELTDFEAGLPFPVLLSEYQGIVESNAYQIDVHRGQIYVADAAANSILKVHRRTGDISTVAVLPATTITFPAELEAALESQLTEALGVEVDVPDCIVGKDYTPEPVPTDVKVGKDGRLYVSTLQGSAGEILPLSKVYRVNPRTGRASEVAGGMHGVTGLALASHGRIVVAEMFGGEVSVIRPHHRKTSVKTLFTADSPADVEVAGKTLYATTGIFGDGALVKYRLSRW